MRTSARVAAALLLLSVTLLGSLAGAVRTTGYAAWTPLTGSANNYATTMQLPAQGFPRAVVASDSRSGSVGVISGATSWLGANTPIGTKYGSSQDQPYLNLRPRADSATTPSVTTYTFDRPTPPTGWMVAFADIDADQVRVTAKDANGTDVSAAELGFQSGFNFCDTSPRPGSCSTSIGDVPTWNAGTQTLVGNPTSTDTVGATGWFEPSVSLSTLTVTYTRRSGFPVYATYFASVARTIAGTVTDVSTGGGSCAVTGVTVRLVGPYGDELATTTPDSTGAYSFGQYATQPGYTVSVEPPATCAAVGGSSRTVSTATTDAATDFSVREIIPQPVSGTVLADGQPLAGVTVTLHAPGGGTKTTTTAADGTYLFDNNPIEDGYFVSIDVPAGYDGADQGAPFNINATPITGQDFELTANPAVSGTVTGGGSGLGGVTVVLTPLAGPPLTTVTAGDGTYTFPLVPAGTYDISAQPPDGYDAAPPIDGLVVASDDVTDQDFDLTRPGALGGSVTDDTDPVAGVDLVIDGPGAPQPVTTDADGQFFLDGLEAGTYEIELTVPDGFTAVGPPQRTAEITDQGETLGGQDFELARVAATPTPSPTPSPSATPSTTAGSGTSGSVASTSSTELPSTGSDVTPGVVLLGALLVVAGTALLAGSRLLRRRKR